jgi:aldose 1-epimerase
MQTTLNSVRTAFQTTIGGKQTDLFFIKNNHNARASICNYGARWISMQLPDHREQSINVIVGFNTIKDYQTACCAYYGATVGRYANRIAKGIFSLGNNTYQLPLNGGANHLHGGQQGLHNVVWDVVERTENSVLLSHISPDGTEGFPGNLELFVRYTLSDENLMRIDYTATTDKETIINLTNHSYFNLNGGGSIANHILTIHSNLYTPTDANMIPTGEILPVTHTPFDFRNPRTIVIPTAITSDPIASGAYDHNFVLRKENENDLSLAASAKGDISGITMDVITTEPGLQFYCSNCPIDDFLIQNRINNNQKNNFCLETQHFPDSPNQPHFPTVILKPSDHFSSTTIYRFSV